MGGDFQINRGSFALPCLYWERYTMKFNLKYLFIAIAVAIVGWLAYGNFFAPAAQKDFFECGANNTLVACPVGETPDADTHGDCRAVGDGDTTLDDGTCS